MSTDSTSIFSIEVKSDLRLDFDNLASPSEKFRLTSNSGFVFAVVDSSVKFCSLRSIFVCSALKIHGAGFSAPLRALN